MTAAELAANGFEALSLADPDREINGVYIGDLLSWVMGNASAGNAWITIMSNINVVAVAVLTDVACIILSENAELAADALLQAEQKGINVLKSPLPSYETAIRLHGLLS